MLRETGVRVLVTILWLALLAAPSASTLGQTPAIAGASTDQVTRYFFHPRMIVASAQRIGLTPEQRQAIQDVWEATQAEFRRQRFELSNAMTVMAGLSVQHPVEELDVVAQLDRILEIENEIKRDQLVMLVRIKNLLTPEQHVALDEIRRQQQQRARQQRQQDQDPRHP